MSAEVSNKNRNENGMDEAREPCEVLSHGGCPAVEQSEFSRHQATAKRRWKKEMSDRVLFEPSEQNLCDQARPFSKNEWLSSVGLESIKRRVLRGSITSGEQKDG